MNRENVETLYRLSPVQQGMLFHTLYAPGEGVYFEQFNQRFGEDFDPAGLARVWQELADRNPALRTAFVWESLGEPIQVVHRKMELPFEILDWRGLPEEEKEARLEDYRAEQRHRGFDLVQPPLIRFSVIRLRDDDYRLVGSYHHMLLDGWSASLLFQEARALYHSATADGPLRVLPRRPFRDYITWLRQQDLSGIESYWRRVLGGFTTPTPLGVDRSAGRGHHEDLGRDMKVTFVPAGETDALKAWARKNRLSLSTVVQGAWALVLSRYSGEDDLVYGLTVSGRPPSLPGVEVMLGCFINTLPVRVRLPAGETVLSWLQTMQADQTELRRYEHSPLVEVLGWSDVARPTPLFESIFVFEGLLEGTSHEGVFQRTNYPLTLVAGPDREIVLRIDYELERFEPAAIERLLGHLKIALSAFLADPGRRLEEIGILTPEERGQLLAAVTTFPSPLCLHEAFTSQAARTPGAPAVTFEGESLSYRELNERANRLAHHLQRLGVGPESRVGLCVDRSLELVAGVLGILKAGGAYVPLDPRYPASRLTYIAEDSGIDVVVTTEDLRDRVPGVEVVCLGSFAGESAENPESGAGPDHLAYVIYTSGSTGKPKGSLITHRNVTRLFAATEEWFHFDERDVWSLFHSYAFDFSVWELWGALLYGGRLVVVPFWVSRSPEAFHELLVRERVTVLNQTPSAFRQLVQAEGEGELSLRYVVFGGEALELSSLGPWFDRHGDERPLLVNMYGITETTVHVTWRPVRRGELAAAGPSPIGVPIPDLAVHLLDRHGHLVPVGVAGEMYVAGAGVARGYLGRPELTAERFVPDPFGSSGERLYRSGDLARRLPDGEMEYLGRIDHQVKVRGFRIELGEIEAVLGGHPSVREAVVLPWEEASGDRRLVGYVVPRERGIDVAGLRAFLKDRLPEYMVPSAVVEIAAIPLTAHGKVDRKALPDPSETVVPVEKGFDPPRTPTEELLAGIWSEVLRVERVGRGDSFFDLGGHSLLATRVTSRLREVLGVDLPLRELFEAPTVAELAPRIEAARSGTSTQAPPLVRGSREGDLPLSFSQERLWFLDQLQPGTAFYNIPNSVRMSGALDVAALRRSLAEVVRRHEALHTVFAVREGQPTQVIREDLQPALPLVDVSALPGALQKEEIRRLAAGVSGQAFDLAAGPLLRAALLRLEEREHVLLLTFHHIVSDAWSLEVLLRELAALYLAFFSGRSSPLPELPVQYADFARWQRQWLDGAALETQLAYWRERLAGVPVLQLPGDRPRPAVQSFHGAMYSFALPEPLAAAVHTLARARGTTVFMVLLTAYEALLARCSGQEDFAVGSPTAGRDRREIEGLIGFFVNTLVLRASLEGDPEIQKLLERVRTVALEGYAHQGVPFERIVQELAPERNLSYPPLFQVMLAFQSLGKEGLELPGLTLAPQSDEFPVSKFDLTLTAFDSGSRIFGQWVYSTALFERGTIGRWSAHFQVLLESLVADPARRVSELPLLTAAEREQILVEWNRPPVDYPEEGFVHQLFEAQVEKTPEAVAIVFEGESLTFHELNARANRLARRLRRQGAGPEVLVGISAERSFEMVVGLLAILKAGSAYLPLDPSLPAERLSYMRKDAGIELLLTGDLPDCGEEEAENLAVPLLPENSAYVIYTSGSTGQPKGVVISHRALGNRLQYARAGDVLASDTFLQKTTISFDVSLLELFAPLVIGGRMVLARPGGQQDPAYLIELIREQRITYTSFPPSLLYVLFEQEGFDRCDSLRVVITGGETVPAVLPGQFYARLPGATLLNRYGPTETTISVTSWLCERGTPRSLPIGRPTAKARVYLLDARLQPVPVGITGEIFLGGVCVARGYLRRPELTAAVFVPDPLGEPGARLYRTGDLARYGLDGAIEFTGRVDQQVKIRGFRVELGEIEAALTRHPAIHEVAVIDREEGATRSLAAYLVFHPGVAPGEGELRRFLLESLPVYMVPADFVILEALPLSSTGKVDRKALPAPRRMTLETELEEPQSPAEEILAGIYGDVLGLDRVSRTGDFFALGGHSLLATRVVARVREALGADLTLRQLFESPTVAGLAQQVQAARQAERSLVHPPLVRGTREGDLPLSFAQERLWFFHQLEGAGPAYNVPLAFRLEGPLDVSVLTEAFAEILCRHEALRTAFAEAGGTAVQVIVPRLEPAVALLDLRSLDRPRREAELRRLALEEAGLPFDLSRAPLLRLTLLRLGEEEHGLLLTAHHIVCDLWSMGVLLRELTVLYAAFSQGLASPLAELPVQYADYARWQRSWLRGDALEAELDYWRRRLVGAPTQLELTLDHPRPAAQSVRGGRSTALLPPELLLGLQDLGRRRGTTLFMTLLAASGALLSRYASQDEVVIGTPVANRDRIEIDGLIGFFLNTLALRLDLSGEATFGELLTRTRRETLEDFAHQDLPFEKLVAELAAGRDPATSPIFQALLIVQNDARQRLDLPGLRLSRIEAGGVTALFDLTFWFFESPAGLIQAIDYNRDLFDPATADRMAGHFRTLLASAVADPGRRLSELPLLNREEVLQVAAWSRMEGSPREDRCLHEMIEARTDLDPGAIAVIAGGESLTRGELETRSNRLAHRLRRLGVGPEVRVGLCVERSLQGVVGILAILKAGGVYVPLDPSYPPERRSWMLADAAARVLLTQGPLRHDLPAGPGVEILCLDADWEGIVQESAERPQNGARPENLAYVIYTSGSTGIPKGVGVEHGAVAGYVGSAATAFGYGEGDRFLQMASWSFDASIEELLGSLTVGASVVLWDGELDPGELLRRAVGLGVTVLALAPSFLQVWVREVAGKGAPALPIRLVITGGEALSPEVARLWPFTPLRNARLVDGYGPTEAVITATAWEVPAGGLPEALSSVPIGRPFRGQSAHVLDPWGGPVPTGVPGELLLGGSLARGYLGRPGTTAAKFVPDPFSGTPGARLYRSGDRVRWLPSGDLEFLGRIDQQVKIRGFRIEPGEIEAVLAAHPGVAQAAVAARPDPLGGQQLVAWFVASGDPAPTAGLLRDHIAAHLPGYMVPSVFMALPLLPLNANGKLDRKALPAPEDAALASAGELVPPRTPTEEILAAIWAGLLSRRHIGVHDDFFRVGGHSLLATQLVSRIRDGFGVELPLRRVFERPTLAALAAEIDEEIRADHGLALPPLLPAVRDGDLPLSFAQERLWFLDQLQPGSPAYNMPSAVRLRGELDLDALCRALREIVRRHESLRTRFAVRGGRPVQVIAPGLDLPLPVVDLRGLPPGRREGAVRLLATGEAWRPFDLAAGPLLRATLLRSATAAGEQELVVLLTVHHIVSDGWSVGILIREIGALYGAFAAGRPSPLAELPVQYADFAVWQREWLRGEVLEGQLEYWRRHLRGAPPLLELPTDHPRPPVQGPRGGRHRWLLPADLSEALRALCRAEGVTLFMGLLAAFQGLLQRYTGREDVIVGTPVAGRTRLETEGLIGLFLNSLALRVDLSGDPDVRRRLARTREVMLEAYAHQDLPFEKMVQELAPERNLSHSPLFQVMLVLQNTPGEALEMAGVTLAPVEVEEGGTAKFDLILSLGETPHGIAGMLGYHRDLFEAATTSRLLGHLQVLLGGIVAHPERSLLDLPLLTATEEEQIQRWNDTAVSYPAGICLHDLVEAQVERSPGQIAVTYEEEALTYRELNAAANRLAHRLIGMGVGPEVVVGVFAERSLEMVVALLAVLKAGGAYLPVDPDYPADRVAYMLADSTVPVLLTQEHLRGRLPETGASVVLLDGARTAVGEESDPATGVRPGNLAYVIYTSGSTGRPKGTMNTHRGIVNRLLWMREEYGLTPADRFLQKTPFSFDVSVWELFSPLLNGARLVMARPGGHRDPAYLIHMINAQEITTLHFVPSMLQVFLESPEVETCASLVRVIVGGEVLPFDLQQRFHSRLGARLDNLYGPTEAAVEVTWWPCDREGRRGLVPIGRPIANTRIHLLDAPLRPVPAGVPGELYIGGVQVGRGYLGRPGLTAERFIPDPFSPEPGARLYRTGDLARYLPDGAIDFLGRIDHQVKIRGLRIELGEIEAAIAAHPAVREAVVMVRRPDGASDMSNARLVAYAVPAAGGALVFADLRELLAGSLPDYMLPSSLVVLDAFPLNPSGKVDRRALAAAGGEEMGMGADGELVAPRTLTEELLAAIWTGLLPVPRVGGSDDFFQLGGHSLLATQLVSRIRETFGIELPLRRIFEQPVLAGLAAEVEAAVREDRRLEAPPLRPAARDGDLPLSFAQERLWFLDRLQPGSPVYNLPVAVRLRGALDAGAFLRTLREIARRHESLRTHFAVRGGRPVQVITDDRSLEVPTVDLRQLSAERRESAIRLLAAEEDRRPFDLATGPLVRVTLLRSGDGEHVVLLTLHHIVTDGWSMGVLIREIATLYSAFTADRPSPLPELPLQYADFAVWQRGWLRGETLEVELSYWREQLRGAPPLLELPTDRSRPPVQRFQGKHQRWTISSRLMEEFRAFCRRGQATFFMGLLALFQAVLHRYTGREDVIVGTPVAGRTRVELEPLIGFFLNSLVLRTGFEGDPAVGELLERVRKGTLEAYAHQDLPFEKLVEELAPERNLSHPPLFQVMLVLQNAPTEPLELPGLTLAPVETPGSTAKLDLTLNVRETGHGLVLAWLYNRDLFDEPTISRLSGHFETLLAAAVATPALRISELPLLTASEVEQLREWNDTVVSYPADACLHELIEAQVERSPDAVAVSYEGERLTYGQLDAAANRLAHRLIGMGVGPEIPVGVFAERSLEMVVALLAILKAGGAYLPVDPDYPADRVAYMLADSAVPVLLTQAHLLARLPETGAEILLLDADSSGDTSRPVSGVRPGHLAYVIYTSGSTGRPKGTMNAHRGIVNRLLWMQEEYGLTPADRVLQKTPFSFDVSVWELFWPLLTGARLVMARPGGHQDPGYLVRTIEEEGITTLHFVPSMLQVFLEAPGVERCASLRRVIASGEALPLELQRRFFRRLGTGLHNLYGPTEAAVDVTYWPCEREGRRGVVPIGRPVANTRIHLLDAYLGPVPVGVPGELHIGGVQVGRGYLGRPELTAERFIPDLFSAEPGARLYRTGDLARYLPDGAVDFLGRIDHQVKLRGLRIELGEIESAIAAHPSVREAVVLARGEGLGTIQLVAYVTGEGLPDPAGLRAWLARSLPEHMLPSAWVTLDELPLGPNGKVDRKALAPIAPERATTKRVPPRTAMEHALAVLWSDALNLDEEPGINDNFFELGGNSITGAILINRLQKTLGEIVHVVAIFDSPTIAALAARLMKEYPRAVARLWGEERPEEAAPKRVLDAERTAAVRSLIRTLPPAVLTPARNTPAVFVLSPPRSGSTLLRVMLGGHPLLFAPPELELLNFNTLAGRREAFSGRDAFRLEGLLRAVMEIQGEGPEEARTLIERFETAGMTVHDLYRRLQGWIAPRLLVDKTPTYAWDPATLRRAEESFEEARYIHLVRHPRGMIRSFEEARIDQIFFHQDHPFSRRELAEALWGIAHQNILEFLAGVPRKRQFDVRFEDLLRDPEGVLRGICGFLEIEYHPDMAEPYKGKSERMTDGLHAESRMLGDVKFHQHRTVDPGVAESWREDSNRGSLGEGTSRLAVRLGYDVEPAGEGWVPIPSVLVGLQPGGAKPPLFLVHPLSGELLLYRHLAAGLGPDQPVYGFQAVGFADDEEPLDTVEEMSAAYVQALLSFQPEGPYLLAGSSLGGVIAFEMARELRSQGREVAFLGLLDAPDPARFGQEGDGDGEAELVILGYLTQESPPVSLDSLRALAPEERLDLLLRLGREAGTLAPSFGQHELGRLVRVVAANRRALRAYAPQPFETRLVYLRAAEGLGDDAVWAGLALGGVEVQEIAGGHLSMHFPPHVEALAERLREYIQAGQREEALGCRAEAVPGARPG